jgi:hypothetical protein
MEKIYNLPDEFDIVSDKYQNKPNLKNKIFLISVPKSGTHLLRNIIRVLINNENVYRPFVQDYDFDGHLEAIKNEKYYFYTGHLNFHSYTYLNTINMRKILLIRDPYSVLISSCKFFYSDNHNSYIKDFFIKNNITPSQSIDMLINGVYDNDVYIPSIGDIYKENAIKWFSSSYVVKYEDLISGLDNLVNKKDEAYIKTLLKEIGFDCLPENWIEIIADGANPKWSKTSNLVFSRNDICTYLTLDQRLQFEMLNPGLRNSLGYQ